MPALALLLEIPFIGPLLLSVLQWIFRKAVIGFVIATAFYFIVDFFEPILLRLVGSFLSVSIPDLVAGIPQQIWYFAAAFQLELGIKLTISAYTARFLVRRIPLIG